MRQQPPHPTPAQDSSSLSALPLRRDPDPVFGTSGLGVFQAFTAVLFLILLLAWVLRRRAGFQRQGGQRASTPAWLKWLATPAPRGGLQVQASRRLTAKASVHLLHWNDREWLVGCTDEGIRVLGDRPLSEGTPSARSPEDQA